MALPVPHSLKEYTLSCHSPSIGASPIVGYVRVPKRGRMVKIGVVQSAAVTGTGAVAVAINGGTAITSAAMAAITAGGAGTLFTATLNGTDVADVNEDDVISFTPSGATGATITGHFFAVIRA